MSRSSTSAASPHAAATIAAVSTVRSNGLVATPTGSSRATRAATAAACSRPASFNGGSIRPSSTPVRLASVWPWRTKTSWLTAPAPWVARHGSSLAASRSLPQPTRVPELAPDLRNPEVELTDDPPARDQPDQLLDQHHPPHREQRNVAERCAVERPPEHLGVQPRARQHEPGEDADRQAQPAPPRQPRPVEWPHHHDDERYHREEQRVPEGTVTEWDVDEQREQRSDRDEPVVEADALEHVRDQQHRHPDVPEEHGSARVERVERGVHEEVGVGILLAPHVCEIDVLVVGQQRAHFVEQGT